jgi:hypothetical protein
MKVKALAMAACMGLSLNAYAQTYSPNSSSGSGYSSEGRDAEAAGAQDRTYSERTDANRCNDISDRRARARCLDAQASAGQGMGIITQQPGASGPGAIDKTHPGAAGSGFSASPRDVGTSSAGSGA